MVHISGIIGALLAITGVRASPYDSLHVGSPHRKLRSRDLATHNCVDFGTGSPNGYVSLGQVCVDITATAITVTYPTLSGGNTYTGAHLYIGTTPPTKRAPGLFPYNSYCTASGTSASCTVPLAACVQIGCGTTLYIAAQADVSGPASGTGWGQGTCFDCNNCVQSNCAKYWSFPTECKCTVVTTYAPITCTSTITTTTEFVTQPSPSTGVTSCDVPTATTLTIAGPVGTCPACAFPYFCGC